jgi:hypothetical protein
MKISTPRAHLLLTDSTPQGAALFSIEGLQCVLDSNASGFKCASPLAPCACAPFVLLFTTRLRRPVFRTSERPSG